MPIKLYILKTEEFWMSRKETDKMKQDSIKMFIKGEVRNIFKCLPMAILLLLILAFQFGCSSSGKNEIEIDDQTENLSIQKVIGIGRIEPELKIVGLASEVEGIVQYLHVQAGDSVRQGQVIVELAHAIEQARIAQARARLNAQQAVIESTRAALESVQIQMENDRVNWQRIKNLFEKGAENQANYDNATAKYQSSLAEVNQLEAEVSGALNILKQNQADLNLAEAQLLQKKIIAPADGQVLSLDVTVGSAVSPGKSIGDFAPKSPLTAWCEIDELFATKVKLEQKAFIRPEGLDDTLAVGTVSFVGPYLRKKSIFSDDVGVLEDRRTREVRIRITPDTLILLGQRVECVIFTDKVEGK
jgi:multidrug efflux pump subunit AcrA (membrane-fusion protein)